MNGGSGGVNIGIISVKAVALGTAVTLVLDMLIGGTTIFLFGQSAFQPGISEAEATRMLGAITHDTSFLLVALVLGTLTTIVGGYVCAKVAKRLPYMNAAAMGVVGLVVGVLLADGDSPLWFTISGLLVVLPSALLGGYFAKVHAHADV